MISGELDMMRYAIDCVCRSLYRDADAYKTNGNREAQMDCLKEASKYKDLRKKITGKSLMQLILELDDGATEELTRRVKAAGGRIEVSHADMRAVWMASDNGAMDVDVYAVAWCESDDGHEGLCVVTDDYGARLKDEWCLPIASFKTGTAAEILDYLNSVL